jgi:hypothetical protein
MFSGNGAKVRFAPLERGGMFWVPVFYKHFVPTGRGDRKEHLAKKKQEVTPLYYRDCSEKKTT